MGMHELMVTVVPIPICSALLQLKKYTVYTFCLEELVFETVICPQQD